MKVSKKEARNKKQKKIRRHDRKLSSCRGKMV